jgi:hypothetical protein
MEELLELIALVYWHVNEDCGGDFDETCFGTDNGPCHNYEFCKKYNKVKAAIIQAEKAEKTWKS